MKFGLKVDVSQLVGRVRNAPKRIAFAVVNAINATLRLAQRALVLRAEDIFILRPRGRRFIERNVAVIKPFASVGQGRAFGEISVGQKKGLLLPGFEKGGPRRPFVGTRAVAVPVAARPSQTANVPESLYISRLGLRKQKSVGRLRRSAGGIRGGRPGLEGRLGTYSIPGVGIFQRIGGVVRMLYVFVRNVRIKPVLRFVETVRAISDRNFAKFMREEVRKALAFARGR